MPKPCLIQQEGTRRDPENCAKFSRCMNVGGEFLEITFDCPNSTIYSESKNICDYPDNLPDEKCETNSKASGAEIPSTTASTDLKASDQSATTSGATSATTSDATSETPSTTTSATNSVPLEDKSKCVLRFGDSASTIRAKIASISLI